ncbi:MAG: sugar phosphate isomerase/epimerase [Clostridia bacterium]|nr:sugar phosphate isomerase/epimerase [Clostridia bacterium]
MKIATTTGDFGSFCKNDMERIRELHRAGFRYVDLSMYSWTPESVYMTDGWREAVAELKAEAEGLGMQFVQAHSQGGNPLDEDPAKVDFIVAATLRSLEVCQALGIPNTVVHPGFARGITKEEWFEKNKAFFLRLLPAAERLGVNVLAENSTAANMKDRYFANSGRDMVEFIRFVDHPRLHACWDTGHANCEGSQYDEILALGEELYAIHYNDNHGSKDEHLIPYFGTLNHDEVLHALMEVGFKGPFTLECSSSLIPRRYWLGSRRPFEGDTRLAERPLFMQRKLIALLYETAEYMLTAYGLLEK